MIVQDHDGFSVCCLGAIRLLSRCDRLFTCYNKKCQSSDVSLCWLLKFQHSFLNSKENATSIHITIWWDRSVNYEPYLLPAWFLFLS